MAEDVYRERLLEDIRDLEVIAFQAEKTLDAAERPRDLVYDIWQQVNEYRAGDEPHKAAYLLGRIHAMLAPWASSYTDIQRHKTAKAKLETYDRKKVIDG